LPLTFHIEHGLTDREFGNFRKYFNKIKDDIDQAKAKLQALIRENGTSEDLETSLDDESIQ